MPADSETELYYPVGWYVRNPGSLDPCSVLVMDKPSDNEGDTGFYSRTISRLESDLSDDFIGNERLEALVFPLTRREGALPSPYITVGRNKLADVVLNDRRVSKVHAYISKSFEGTSEFLKDASSNGTWVDGVRVEKGEDTFLSDGASLAFGGPHALQMRYFTPETFADYLFELRRGAA